MMITEQACAACLERTLTPTFALRNPAMAHSCLGLIALVAVVSSDSPAVTGPSEGVWVVVSSDPHP